MAAASSRPRSLRRIRIEVERVPFACSQSATQTNVTFQPCETRMLNGNTTQVAGARKTACEPSVTGELTNYNFLKTLRRLDLTTRLSKIGTGDPVSGLDALCPQARRDPFSSRLNYYVGASLRQPSFSGLRLVPTIT